MIYGKYFDEIFVWFRGSWSYLSLFGTCEIQETLKMAREMPREDVLEAIYVDDELQTGMKAGTFLGEHESYSHALLTPFSKRKPPPGWGFHQPGYSIYKVASSTATTLVLPKGFRQAVKV